MSAAKIFESFGVAYRRPRHEYEADLMRTAFEIGRRSASRAGLAVIPLGFMPPARPIPVGARLPPTDNGQEWARAFIDRIMVHRDPLGDAMSEDTMGEWFANAILRGSDTANKRRDQKEARTIAVALRHAWMAAASYVAAMIINGGWTAEQRERIRSEGMTRYPVPTRTVPVEYSAFEYRWRWVDAGLQRVWADQSKAHDWEPVDLAVVLRAYCSESDHPFFREGIATLIAHPTREEELPESESE